MLWSGEKAGAGLNNLQREGMIAVSELVRTFCPFAGAKSRAFLRAGLLAAPFERIIMTPSTDSSSVPTSLCTRCASIA